MGIKTTLHISRRVAIERITKVYNYVQDEDYLAIEKNSSEESDNIEKFVEATKDNVEIDNIHKFTNSMLEEIMDKPYFRNSYFDNYLIEN